MGAKLSGSARNRHQTEKKCGCFSMLRYEHQVATEADTEDRTTTTTTTVAPTTTTATTTTTTTVKRPMK